MRFRNPRARGCSNQSGARALLKGPRVSKERRSRWTKRLTYLEHSNGSSRYKSNGIAAFKKQSSDEISISRSAEVLRQQWRNWRNQRLYSVYNPAKLLALAPCVPGTRDSSHTTNEQSIILRGTNLWLWPEKLDPFRIALWPRQLRFNHTHFQRWTGAPALKTMNKRSLTHAVSKKPRQHTESQCEKHGQLLQLTILFTVNTLVYSYSLCMLFVIILQPKQGY